MSLAPRGLIIQRDRTVLLDLHVPGAELLRIGLSRFAELVKSPEHLHTYRITGLSLWTGAFNGLTAADIFEFLRAHSANGLPRAVQDYVEEMLSRTGKVRLTRVGEDMVLDLDPTVRDQILGLPSVTALLEQRGELLVVNLGNRGLIKHALVKAGFPVEDFAGFVGGDELLFRTLTDEDDEGGFMLRPYQDAAARAFFAEGTERGGAGLVVLPCGAGKTVVGIRCMELYQKQTLILTTNRSAVAQWKRELLERTSLTEDDVGEYSGQSKEIKPVTVSTYQILTHRRGKEEGFTHFGLFSRANWGLIVYDEVHLLPAPVFRVTAELQARRRLGLTATLVREDGKEDEVFSLIGPCRYELPWRDLERQGFIAEARCVEVRVPLDRSFSERYELSDKRGKIRLAAENPAKLSVLQHLVDQHAEDRVLVIGQYLQQLYGIARLLGAPIITSKTPNPEREELYRAFRLGELPILVVSKVANFAIDLPDANVAIQLSGTFGSRQEEAQRLGRVLRPKSDGGDALFYTIVTADTRDQEFAAHRQLFLAEQGYRYDIVTPRELMTSRVRPLCSSPRSS